VKTRALLAEPATLTTTLPVAAPLGTGATMFVLLQLDGVAGLPLNVTELEACVAPKLAPVMVTEEPTVPELGERFVMEGREETEKTTALLAEPATLTTTLPVAAPLGTGATMFVLLQLDGVAGLPLNVTVLEPCVAPKLVPVIVTEVPTIPELGERFVMAGGDITVKTTGLLAKPATLTTTLPVAAPLGTGTTMFVLLQLAGEAGMPLNVTVLEPRVAPKFVPVIVIEEPTVPELGERFVIAGGDISVKTIALLTAPATLATTLPVTAPLGTGATMFVLLQLDGVAGLPLNITELVPCVAPKLVPVIVTEVPTVPELGERFVMAGGDITVKTTGLLAKPATLTTTLPVAAPLGTGTTMFVLLQLVGEAGVPLNVTVLEPRAAPKFVPVIVIEEPTVPELGERFAMVGGVVPPLVPPAVLKAAIIAIQSRPEAESFEVTLIAPGVACIASSSA
jgi:hypothetical protein